MVNHTSHLPSYYLARFAIFACTGGIFLLDLFVPLGMSLGVLYVLVVVSTLSLKQKWVTLTTATLTALAIVGGWVFSPPGIEWLSPAINRLLSLGTLGIVTWMVLRQMSTTNQLEDLQVSLQDKIQDRTADLEQQRLATLNLLEDIDKAKGEIEQKEALLNNILNHAEAAIYVKDLSHRYLLVNPTFATYFQRSPEDFTGKTDEELFDPSIASLIGQGEEEVLQHKTPLKLEQRVVFSHKLKSWLTIKFPLLDSFDQPYALCSMATDITELERSRQLFHQIVEAAPTGMIMVDQAGAIVMTNALTCVQFGYTSEELLHQPVELLVPTRFQATHPEKRAGFMAHPEPRAMGSGRDLYGLRKDGTEFPLEIGLNPITTEEGAFVLASVADITKRIEGEKSFAQLYRHHQLLLNSAGEGIYGMDANGITTFINPAAAQMLGFTPEELIGVPIHDTAHHTKVDGSAYPLEECPMYKTIHDGAIHTVDNEVLWRKDGSCFPVQYTTTPICDETGRAVGAVVTFKDITDRKQAEEAVFQWTQALERSNKELDDFAYIASHDLKEPLRGIHNYCRFLIEDYAGLLGEEGNDQCQTIMRLTQRMEELINSLLYFSRIGRSELAIRDVDLDRVVLDVLDTLKPRLDEEHISIRYPTPLPTFRCDEARVAEIFRNLITNAMKYNDKTDKWIEIGCMSQHETLGASAEQRATSSEKLHFYVRDNGIGIPEKHFENVFRIFKRLQGRDQFGGGTGAGLTIIQKVVHRHGGRIWLESTVGEGTTFWFTLAPSAGSSATDPVKPSTEATFF